MAFDNKNIYINSFQACDIMEHQWGKYLKYNYLGMMPFSLESIKLEEFGMKVFLDDREKLKTHDIINIRFKLSTKGYNDIDKFINIQELTEKINEAELKLLSCENKREYIKIENYLTMLSNTLMFYNHVKENRIEKMDKHQLRNELYKNGFYYNGVKYVVYKRTSAKSRTGQCQFIKESLRDKAIKWARLGMELDGLNKDDGIDFPSLLAYEGLVSSSIVDTIKINTDNILLISDVISKYKVNSSIVEVGNDGLLTSRIDNNYEMTSDLFDGESLIDKSCLKNGKGSALLRNHMFKSCAFSIDIKGFFKDYCKSNDFDYDNFKVKDMFGDEMYAKDVLLITTPNSLKALKFSKRKGSPKKMYQHWKKKVNDDNCIFGICKFEKESKRGRDEFGNILNRTSYQIINSMPFTRDEIRSISELEKDFIKRIKNDDEFYIEHLISNANDINSNEMISSIYQYNKNILNVKEIKNKRKSDAFGIKKNIQHGRVRMVGDYCTICQNPKEMMYHSIGELPIDNGGVLIYENWENNHELKNNSAHIPLHDFYKEYPAFRSPHTSPSNVLVLKNTKSEFIEKYMSATDNIVYTNSIGIEINRILSGQDADSDQVVIFDNKYLLNVAKRCYGAYNVCENNIIASPMNYTVSFDDMAKIDNILSESQRNIGEIVNLGQVCMSKYWDLVNNNGDENEIKKMLENVDICTILSEVAIDLAKKMYAIDMKEQIKEISRTSQSSVKPLFFKQVTKGKNANFNSMMTSMDYLYEEFEDIDDADQRKTMVMLDIIKDFEFKQNKKHIIQKEKTLNVINSYLVKRNQLYSRVSYGASEDERSEVYEEIEREFFSCKKELGKYKLSKETMYLCLLEIIRSDYSSLKTSKASKENITSKELLNFMSVMYSVNKNVFLSLF